MPKKNRFLKFKVIKKKKKKWKKKQKRKTPQNCKSPTEVYNNNKKCD